MVKKDSEDMSMEEILASIRRYVSSTNTQKENFNMPTNTEEEPIIHGGKVIHLTEDMIERKIDEPKKDINPFLKLGGINKTTKQKIENTKTQDLTISELIHKIAEKVIHDWVDKNLPTIAEDLINKKIREMSDDIN